MPLLDLENPWTFGVVLTVTLVALFSVLEVTLFDGDVLSAVVQALLMGIVISLLFHYWGRDAVE